MNTKSNVVAGECSLDPLVRCWSCDGTGIGSPAVFNTAGIDIPCDRCKGTGQCPAVMRKWEELGHRIRKVRQDRDQSLREWARQFGVSVVMLSQAERGIIDPRSLPSANVRDHRCLPDGAAGAEGGEQ
jgi:hypothetical protein